MSDFLFVQVMMKGPKSRAYYRMQASKKLAGKQDLNKKMKDQIAAEAEQNKVKTFLLGLVLLCGA